MTKATLSQASKILSVFEDTSSEQVQAVLESGLLADLRDADIAAISRDEYHRVCGLEPLVSTQSDLLLEFVSAMTLPATTGLFVARNWFTVNTNPDAPVKIGYINDNFKEWFLKGNGKVEHPTGEQTFRYARLRQPEVDSSIIAELGGEAKAETTLSAVFALMEKQGHRQDGVLLTNGYANIFYVKDIASSLRAVDVFWYVGGWRVLADSVVDPSRWGDGRRVFSRNS